MTLFNNPILSDYHFIDENGKELYLHKSVLVNRLVHFERHFGGCWKECKYTKVKDIKIYLPVFEYIYTNKISEYDLDINMFNDLIMYADQINLFEDFEFAQKIIGIFNKYIDFQEEKNISSEFIQEGLNILCKYDHNDNLEEFICNLIEDQEEEILAEIFNCDHLRKYIKNDEKLLNLIVIHFKKYNDKEIFNELLNITNLNKLIRKSNIFLIFCLEQFKTNIKYIIEKYYSVKIIKYYPFTIVFKINILNIQNIINYLEEEEDEEDEEGEDEEEEDNEEDKVESVKKDNEKDIVSCFNRNIVDFNKDKFVEDGYFNLIIKPDNGVIKSTDKIMFGEKQIDIDSLYYMINDDNFVKSDICSLYFRVIIRIKIENIKYMTSENIDPTMKTLYFVIIYYN